MDNQRFIAQVNRLENRVSKMAEQYRQEKVILINQMDDLRKQLEDADARVTKLEKAKCQENGQE